MLYKKPLKSFTIVSGGRSEKELARKHKKSSRPSKTELSRFEACNSSFHRFDAYDQLEEMVIFIKSCGILDFESIAKSTN